MNRRVTCSVVAAGVLAVFGIGRAEGAISSAGSGYWTNPASWSPAQVPTSTDDVIIVTGHTNIISTNVAINVGSLTINAGGVLTHLANGTTGQGEQYKVVLNIASNLTIDAGGRIDVDAKGYAAGSGIGVGSHGGLGAPYGGFTAGPTYGSFMAPTNLGSGGLGGSSAVGGGAVILNVTGTSVLAGTISANGGVSGGGWGAPGGSVYLRTGTISGSPTITANGSSAAGGNGGGRIAIVLTSAGADFSDFVGATVSAYGGAYGANGGAAGTIYRETQAQSGGRGVLTIDNNDRIPAWDITTAIPSNQTWTVPFITLSRGGILGLPQGVTFNLTNSTLTFDAVTYNSGITLNGGTLIVPEALSFTNFMLRYYSASTFSPASITVGNHAQLISHAAYTLPGDLVVTTGGTFVAGTGIFTVGGSVTVAGGTLTHLVNAGTETYKLNLAVASNLNVQMGGKINVDAKGYTSGNGPGVGSHGGLGITAQSIIPGSTYGSLTAPTNLGSGGLNNGSHGGGAAILNVAGTSDLSGTISAMGEIVQGWAAPGGSIYIRTKTITGSPTINANGSSATGAGGGGRIAIVLTGAGADFSNFGGAVVTAYGASGGAAGTIYKETQGQGPGNGTLLINANNVVSTVTTLISSQVTDTVVGTVVITNAAVLAVSNAMLTVQGDWDNKAAVTGMINGTVRFAGTNAAAIRGHNTFYNFTCTNAGKKLSFEDGKTNAANGVLTLAGITLNSISGGQWYLKASANTHSVSNVTVSWSDARPGSAIEAFDSIDNSNNYNWVFAESGFHTNYWTGATDTDWTKSGNWSRGRSTQLSDTVVVTNGCPNYPLLPAATRILSLAVSNGASVGLTNFNLVVDDDVRVAGTLTASGTEKLTVGGDLDFTGGTFSAATSTVWIAGSSAQTVVSDGESFRNLAISNNAAPVTFTDAVTATNIVNYATPVTFVGPVTAQTSIRTVGTNVIFGGAVTAPAFYNENGALVFSGTVSTVTFTNWQGNLTFRDAFSSREFYCAPGGMSLTFGAGKITTIGNFDMYGRSGYPIVLRSSSDGNAWNLNVTNWSKVRQADVKDSHAEAGQMIRPVASANSGNNTNWDFGGPWQTWVGTASEVFTNANNWAPAGSPDANAHLLIDGFCTTAPVLSGAATAAQVIVGGYTTATVTVNGQLTTVGNVDILTKGTITHSANTSSEANKLYLTVGSNLTLASGAQINVDAKGYAVGQGLGVGSHGGVGALHVNYTVGLTYGSITAPTNLGSGGSAGGGGSSAHGGGAAILNVAGASDLSGTISANGEVSSGWGAPGGSVCIRTKTITGSPTIMANGGSGVAANGGGRIAIILTGTDADFSNFGGATLSAYGGISGDSGAAGTIYKETQVQGPGKGILLIDAGNIGSTVTTLISSNVTDTVVGTVILKNQAILAINTNQSLTVNGSWTNAATFTAYSNSTVNFASTNTATVAGANTFYNLTAGADGKTIRFEAGKTNTVNGMLIFRKNTTLLSTQNGVQWWLNLSSSTGTQNVGRVTVKDSNAGGGQTINAGNGSINLLNNVNWFFPPGGAVFVIR